MKSTIHAFALTSALAGTGAPCLAWDDHVSLYVGYADSEHPQKPALDPCCHPNPFFGSPHTQFIATPLLNGRFDSGFLLIHNGSSTTIIIDSVDVYIGNSHLNPWGTAVTFPLPPGWNKIIGQIHSFFGGNDFDTSEYHCVTPKQVPVVKIHFKDFITGESTERSWKDQDQILIHDNPECGGAPNETHGWVLATPE